MNTTLRMISILMVSLSVASATTTTPTNIERGEVQIATTSAADFVQRGTVCTALDANARAGVRRLQH